MKAHDPYASTWWEVTSQFQTTPWTQLRESELSSIVMGELYLKYRKPVDIERLEVSVPLRKP